MEHQRFYQYKKEKNTRQPASVNLPFSFVSFIAVGTTETNGREVSSPRAVSAAECPLWTERCSLTCWLMFVTIRLVFPQMTTDLFVLSTNLQTRKTTVKLQFGAQF